jgi:predicted DNA-binding protein
MALYSVRLDDASAEALATAARNRKVNRAVILREAIAEYASTRTGDSSPFAQMSSLIGVIDRGPGNLSEETGKSFARLIRQQAANKRVTPAVKRRPKQASR